MVPLSSASPRPASNVTLLFLLHDRFQIRSHVLVQLVMQVMHAFLAKSVQRRANLETPRMVLLVKQAACAPEVLAILLAVALGKLVDAVARVRAKLRPRRRVGIVLELLLDQSVVAATLARVLALL